ncbi:MAG: hypothetical protein ACKVW3_14255 [Phycisphaerales bacterium]
MADQNQIGQLTPHEDEEFVSQTVYLSGHAYRRCHFDRCTFVVTNMPFVMTENRIVACNWRIECDVLWGDPNTRSNLRRLLDAIDGAMDELGMPPR